MADASVTVGQLRERLEAFVRARNWEPFHNPKDLAMALSVEASELLERFLWRAPPSPSELATKDLEGIAEELADVVIYALHLTNTLGIDLSDAVLRKIEQNEARFPVPLFRSAT